MSAYPVGPRQGKATMVAGVASLVTGFVLQAVNVQSVGTQAPVFGAGTSWGRAALLGEVAGLLMLGGVILTIIGVIRYAQSGSSGSAVYTPAPIDHMAAAPRSHPSTVPVSTPAFCSSCGAGIVGEGRYCASCGAPTTR